MPAEAKQSRKGTAQWDRRNERWKSSGILYTERHAPQTHMKKRTARGKSRGAMKTVFGRRQVIDEAN